MTSLAQHIFDIKSGKSNIQDQINIYIAKANNSKLNSWLEIVKSENISDIYDFDKLSKLPLAGAAIGVKDIIMTKNIKTTCGSKMLVDFLPSYDATCVQNLIANGGVVIGKNNLDEFAMWWSGENSAFGIVQNPVANWRISGGSSSGSAAAVADDECVASVGTDTWWSVRQPAAMCGIVGFKPTYGFVSRYGVQSMANSLDQVWVLAKTVDDAWLLLQNIWWYDKKDSTSQDYHKLLNPDTLVKKIAIIKQFYSDGLDPQISDRLYIYISKLKNLWYIVEEVDFELLKYVVAVYYTIMPAEASTNLARFDGVKFGAKSFDTQDFVNYKDYLTSLRSELFGDEVKKRIMIWWYVLSAGFADEYYKKAVKIRNLICKKFDEIFLEYDLIIWPTTPTAARLIWSVDDPLSDYLADIYTIPANLAWLPAISVPVGTINIQNQNLPIWLQIMWNKRNELKVVELAKVIEWIKI